MNELRIDRTKEHDELDVAMKEWEKENEVTHCPKQLTREQYLALPKEDEEPPTYTTTTISWGQFKNQSTSSVK